MKKSIILVLLGFSISVFAQEKPQSSDDPCSAPAIVNCKTGCHARCVQLADANRSLGEKVTAQGKKSGKASGATVTGQ